MQKEFENENMPAGEDTVIVPAIGAEKQPEPAEAPGPQPAPEPKPQAGADAPAPDAPEGPEAGKSAPARQHALQARAARGVRLRRR